MSLAGNKVFTFTWSIDNFSMCAHKCGERIESPKFSVDILEETKWALRLYPRGYQKENEISCFLLFCGNGSDSKEITLDFKLAIMCAKTGTILEELTTTRHTFKLQKTWGWNKIVSRDDVYAHRDKYLPNDTFTVQLSGWCEDNAANGSETNAIGSAFLSQSETAVFKELFSNATINNINSFKTLFSAKRGSVRTVIKVRKRTVCWPIKNFSSLPPNQRLSIPLISSLVDVPSFYLTFYLSDSNDQFPQIEIRRKERDCSNDNLVRCQISVVHTRKSYLTKDEHLFKSSVTDDVWKFPFLIKLSELEEEKYLEATRDVLYLRCEFAFSQLGDVYHSEDVDLRVSEDQNALFSNVSSPLKNHLENFYKDGEFSDMTLQASDKIFKVHKIILSANSFVFRTMFKNEMKEKETGVVDIKDLSPDTVDRMLTFMYGNILENLNPTDAIELYTAADKYQVFPLKFQCNCVLKSTLSISNVCDVLRLADLHNDEDLKDAVQEFIHSNSRIILQSPEWKDLMKYDPGLAADVMYKMLNNNLF